MRAPRQQKLRASTARRAVSEDEIDYEEMSEPNMKLSRALLIVLVLHVVAVAGIIAFNTIKSRQGAFPPASSTTTTKTEPSQLTAPPKGETPALASAANSAALPKREETTTPAAPVAKALPAEPVKTAATKPGATAEDGKYYIVAKGDNPMSIAKKLKVSQYELLSANGITDPTKLQIGQKLIIPPQKAAAKTTPKSKKSDG
ncbi:MAG TPA: LysM peptidoglycan-binding domain-containing protein [Chthoniobacterales bacterium]|nr:LysM peptidoglycan-binding domain-containing protein [Chthoniobacterales bacterium]